MGPFFRKNKSEQPSSRRNRRQSPEPQFKDGAKLYGVRHGEPDYNKSGTLTDKGEDQANWVGSTLVEEGFTQPGLFIASSAHRARQTAEIAAQQFELLTGEKMRVVASDHLRALMLRHAYRGQEAEALAAIAAAASQEAHTDLGWVDHVAFFGHEPFLGIQKWMNEERENTKEQKAAQPILLQSVDVAHGEVVNIDLTLWPRY